jgi:hypothetical protein
MDHTKLSANISVTSSENKMPVAAKPVGTATTPMPSSAEFTTSATAKPVQPVRVDSGVSLIQNDNTRKAPLALDRSKVIFDGSMSNTKRQSGDELAGWLAISNMLDRL